MYFTIEKLFYFMQIMANGSNCTETDSEIAASALIVLMTSISGIIGNLLVISSYFVTGYLRNQPSNCLVINLAVTDFLSCVYIQMPCIANLYDPNWQLFLIAGCSVHAIIIWIIFTASKWTLATISLDRATAVNMPLKYTSIVTAFRIRYNSFVILDFFMNCKS